MLAAVALILGWIEHMVPITGSIPYIKLGLGNIAVVFALYMLNGKCAAAVSASKVILSSLLFSGFSGFLYSSAGAIFSFIIMLIMKKTKKFTPVGISAAAGAAHMTAQIMTAIILTSTPQIIRLSAPLMALGTLTGTMTGFAATIIIISLKKINVLKM